MIVAFISMLVFSLYLLVPFNLMEGFQQMFNMGTRFQCPTRNQSYDLRGDPHAIPRIDLPHNNSGFGPLHPEDCRY